MDNEWKEGLPPEIKKGVGTYSEMVDVELSDGTIAEDFLINGKWVTYCKKNGGVYPVRWKWKTDTQKKN